MVAVADALSTGQLRKRCNVSFGKRSPKHIPERYERLLRYCGWYSNRSRRARVAKTAVSTNAASTLAEAMSEFAQRAKPAWARLIRKVHESDPLECPKCKAPMRVIALIDDPSVMRRILEHVGHWAPEPAERGPPAQAPDWLQHAVIPLASCDDPTPLRIRAMLR